jgi:hypothetical protein
MAGGEVIFPRRIDANQPEIVKAFRQLGCEVAITSNLGHGFPDLIVGKPKRQKVVLVEVKDGSKPPSARKLTLTSKSSGTPGRAPTRSWRPSRMWSRSWTYTCDYANDRAAFKPAALLLARELPAGMTLGFRRKLAEQALKEWLFPICRMCFGAKEIVIDSLKGACPKCQGLGLYRYTDEERGQAIGVQNTRSVNRHFTRLATILSEIDRQVSSVVVDQLERNL